MRHQIAIMSVVLRAVKITLVRTMVFARLIPIQNWNAHANRDLLAVFVKYR